MFSALNQGSTYYAMRVENGVVQVNYNYTGCDPPSVASPRPAAPPFPAAPAACSIPSCRSPSPGRRSRRSRSRRRHRAGCQRSSDPRLRRASTASIPTSFRLCARVESRRRAGPARQDVALGRLCRHPRHAPAGLPRCQPVGQTPHGIRSYNVLDASNNVISQLTVPVYLPSDRRNTAITSFNTGFSVANTWYNSLAVTVRRPFATARTPRQLHLGACHRHRPGCRHHRHLLRRRYSARSQQPASRQWTVRHRHPQPLHSQLRLSAADLQKTTSGSSMLSMTSSSPAASSPPAASPSSSA